MSVEPRVCEAGRVSAESEVIAKEHDDGGGEVAGPELATLASAAVEHVEEAEDLLLEGIPAGLQPRPTYLGSSVIWKKLGLGLWRGLGVYF